MHVVRLYAIRVNEEAALFRVLSKKGNQPSRDPWVGPEAMAAVEAQREEVGSPTGVVTGGKADIFPFPRGGCGHGRRVRQDAAL